MTWITLPLLSTTHEVIHTGILSYHRGYFESMAYLLEITESERETTFKSSPFHTLKWKGSHIPYPAKMEILRAHNNL